MDAAGIIAELKSLGNPMIKNTLLKHGAREPFLGVKIEDLKKIRKRVKKDHALALELYNSGISDAMYLAALISDPKQMTPGQLQDWAEKAHWHMLSEYTVPWVAAESPYGLEMGLRWIDADEDSIIAAGWSTLAGLLSITPDEQLDGALLQQLLERIRQTIHTLPNRARYAMNSFVIALGGYYAPLTAKAIETAQKIGKVNVNMGDTACKVPDAATYIDKMQQRGVIGKKRRTVMC